MNRQLLPAVAVLVALVLFLAVNALAGTALRGVRADLTEDDLYTLSQGTKNILDDLDPEEPITLRFFFSKKLAEKAPGVQTYAQRVQELLEEYASYAGGALELIVLDPEPYSKEEELAVGYGMKGAPATVAGELLYFGLAGTNSVDDEETIPFFHERREEFLEYDVTKLVHKLASPAQPVVGLLSTLPIDGGPPDPRNPMAQGGEPWFLVESIRQLFEVRTLARSATEIDPEVDVLMLVHPKELSQETLFAIDQFVLGGGKVLAFVDPLAQTEEVQSDPNNPYSAMMQPRSSSLGQLGQAWGVEIDGSKVAVDRRAALRTSRGEVPYFLGLRGDLGQLSDEDFVTKELSTVNLGAAGVLQPVEGATTEFTPLLLTSEESMTVDAVQVQLSQEPEGLLDSFLPSGKELVLAARITGPAQTAFPDGPPETEEDAADDEAAEGEDPAESEDADGDWLRESQGPIHVIVVADTDLLQDMFWVRLQNFLGMRMAQPLADNDDLVINALDNLTGSNDLISLRSRGRFSRPFDLVADLRREAEDRFRAKEKELEQKLQDTERKINELTTQGGEDGVVILSDEQVAQIEEFKEQRAETYAELREVKHQLRKDIEKLGGNLKLLNVVALPLVLTLALFFGLGAARKARRRS